MARVKSGIVGFSFDSYPSSSIADEESKAKAKKDKEKGSKCISHLILRSTIDYKGLQIDNLKFNYMLEGVPIAVYVMRNVLASELENIAFVTSKETRRILEMARESFFAKAIGKNIEFVDEGDKLSLYGTIKKGYEALRENGPVYFQGGDMPFLTDINPIINDDDIEKYDIILDLNSKERIFVNKFNEVADEFEFFRRNYYWKVEEKNRQAYSVKEPNAYILNPDNIDEDLIEFLTKNRKGGALSKAKLLFFALGRSKRKLKLLGLLAHGLRAGFTKEVSYDYLEKLGNAITNARVRIKVRHRDFARLADIDSLEDWRFYEELVDYAEMKKGGLGYIYPYAEDIERFRKDYEEELRQSIPMYRDFHGFINERFRTLEMGQPQPYHYGSVFKITPERDLESAVEHLHAKLALSA